MERSVPCAISDDEINSNVLRWRVMREDKQSHRGKTSWLYKPAKFSPAGSSGLNQLVELAELLIRLFGCSSLYQHWRRQLLVRLSQLAQLGNLITSWIILPKAGAGPVGCRVQRVWARITKLIIIFGHGHYGTFLIYY